MIIIGGKYSIREVLFNDNRTITYLGNNYSNERIVIREFCPAQFKEVPVQLWETNDAYKKALSDYIEECKELINLQKGEGVAEIAEFIQDNGKFYVISKPAAGISLREFVIIDGSLPYSTMLKMMLPLLSGIDKLSIDSFVFQNITLDSIFVVNGKLKVMGFADKLPHEPWQLVRHMGSIMYYMLVGKQFTDVFAPPSRLGVIIPNSIENVIMKSLNENPLSNFRNVHEFKMALEESERNIMNISEELKPNKNVEKYNPNIKPVKKKSFVRSLILFFVLFMFVASGLIFGTYYGLKQLKNFAANKVSDVLGMTEEEYEENFGIITEEEAPVETIDPWADPEYYDEWGTETDEMYLYSFSWVHPNYESVYAVIEDSIFENGEYVYYMIYPNGEGKLIKENKETGDKETVIQGFAVGEAAVFDNIVYFLDSNNYDYVCSLNLDTNAYKIIYDTSSSNIRLSDDGKFLFFISEIDLLVYKYDISLGVVWPISSTPAYEMRLCDGVIFYTSFTGTDNENVSMNVIDIQTQQEILLNYDIVDIFIRYDKATKRLYFVDDSGGLSYISVPVNTDGKIDFTALTSSIATADVVKVLETEIYFYDIAGDEIFYVDFNEGCNLYKCDLDGQNKTLVIEDNIDYFKVIGDTIYYYGEMLEWRLARVGIDGSKLTKLE